MSSLKRIAVLTGGRSAERDVSLSSGRGVVKALRDEGFDAFSLDPGDNPGQQLFEAGVSSGGGGVEEGPAYSSYVCIVRPAPTPKSPWK